MKLTILSIALLGVFLGPILATDNVNVNSDDNDGGNAHQTVSINNDRKVVNVDNNNGWNSWNTLWDYNTGFMATRIFATKKCIIARMNKNIIPDVSVLPQAIKEKQKPEAKNAPHKELTYTVSAEKIPDLSVYGKSIEGMCKGIPSYLATEAKGQNFAYFHGSCFRAGLILGILGISYCGETYDY